MQGKKRRAPIKKGAPISPKRELPAAAILIFVTALSVLAFEVALTRAFSVLLRYHFVFLTVSLAICGLGLGGLTDFLLRHRYPRLTGAANFLPTVALALALTYPLALILLFATPLAAHLTSLLLVSVVCLLPFLLAGIVLSHLFTEYSALSSRLYFADLCGAALGCVLVIAVLQLVGAVNAAAVCGLFVAVGLVLFGIWAAQRRAVVYGVGVAILLGLALGGNLARRTVDLPVMPMRDDPQAKPLYQKLSDPRFKLISSAWNAFARTDVVMEAGPGGRFYESDDREVYTDGDVPTNIMFFNGDFSLIAPRLNGMIGFFPFRMEHPESCMLIGPGGGLDILFALAVGAKQIEGAELNPDIPRLVRQYRDFCGPLYDYSNVSIQVDEGRSYIQRSKRKYDVIYTALTMTTSTAGSSIAMMESYVNTTEAFRDYYDHLTDRGCLAFVTQSPFLTLRTMLTALDALQAEGMSRAEAVRHLAVANVKPQNYDQAGPYRHMLLMYRQPLSPERSRELGKQIIASGFEASYFPGAFERAPYSWLTGGAVSNEEFVRRLNVTLEPRLGTRLNLMPCPDDRPFMMDYEYGVPGEFQQMLTAAIAAVIILSMVAMMVLLRLPQFPARPFSLGLALLYFVWLGSGFMLVEVCLIQALILYLGYPVLALSVMLFALLLGAGSGSWLTHHWPGSTLRLRAALAALTVAGLVLALEFVLPRLITGTLGWPIQGRCAMTMLLLFPLGLCMGMPFPLGLRIAGGWHAMTVPWAWGLNGLASVIGSLLAVSLAKLYGFSMVLNVGVLIYLLAAGTVALTGRPSLGAEPPETAAAETAAV